MKAQYYLQLIVLAAAIAGSLYAVPVAAQTPPPPTDDMVNAIARELYCPVCENTPLDVCPTRACADWRELIRQKISEGWSAEQIKQYFSEQYGDRVLAVPPRRGLNWLVYVIPPVLLLGGALVTFLTLRGMRRRTLTAPARAPDAGDEYLASLEAELKEKE